MLFPVSPCSFGGLLLRLTAPSLFRPGGDLLLGEPCLPNALGVVLENPFFEDFAALVEKRSGFANSNASRAAELSNLRAAL